MSAAAHLQPLLDLRNIAKSFGAVRALRNISFELRAGEVHALLGENGAGKSTLIKIVTGAHQPDEGLLMFLGRELEPLNPTTAHSLGISCIYQQPALFPDLSVAENLALRTTKPRAASRMIWSEWEAKARLVLERIGADMDPRAKVRELSMPEQQLVEIACALLNEAKVIIMDEPTSALTNKEQQLLFKVVRELRSAGVGIIYISHRLEEIFALADRVTVLRDGISLGTFAAKEMDETALIRLMVGREITQIYPASQCSRGSVALRTVRVSCAAGNIRDINLELYEGEVTGLAGLVGAGRTELARTLFGITPADGGSIEIGGDTRKIRRPQDAIAAGIAYLPEDRRRHGVVLEMSVAANSTLAVLRRLFASGWLTRKAEEQLAAKHIQQLGIKAEGTEALVSTLSGGNQQKVALARWLSTQPRILILDEPTQGVDVGSKSEIHKIIRELALQGVAILMISSDLPEIVGMSDRILVMHGGKIAGELPAGSDAHQIMRLALGKKE